MLLQIKKSSFFIICLLICLQGFSQKANRAKSPFARKKIPSPKVPEQATSKPTPFPAYYRSPSSAPRPVTKQKMCTIQVRSDMKGTLWVNDTSIEVDTFSIKEARVPKKFSYYFVSEDKKLVTEDLQAIIRPHETVEGFMLDLEMKQEYIKAERNEKKVAAKKKLLNSLTNNMAMITESQQQFEISKYEVTVGQFDFFVKESGYDYSSTKKRKYSVRDFSRGKIGTTRSENITWQCDPMGRIYNETEYNLPVVHISWEDAVAFCDWLSEKDEDYEYRLPSINEWNVAAYGKNNNFKYPWGNDEQAFTSYANIADQSLKETKDIDGIKTTQKDNYVLCSPVGSFQPNQNGLYDMIGNVTEWCQNQYYIGGSYATNLEGAVQKKGYYEIADKSETHPGIGFRICRVPK